MKQTTSGSIVVMVLLVLTVIIIWATNVWRQTAYMLDIAVSKQKYEQQFRLTEALLEYGIAAAKLKAKQWREGSFSEQLTCNFTHWPPSEKKETIKKNKYYSGKITIIPHKKNIVVSAQLCEGASIVNNLHCKLSEQKITDSKHSDNELTLYVQEWSMNNAK